MTSRPERNLVDERKPSTPALPERSIAPSTSPTQRLNSNDRTIAERVATLLSHYWIGDEPEAVRTAQAHDWLDDLREFGAAIVARACQEWRQTSARRPTPADLRALAVRFQGEMRGSLMALPGSERARLPGLPVHVTSTQAEIEAYELAQAERAERARLWRASPEGKAWRARLSGPPKSGDDAWTTAKLTPDRLAELTGHLPPADPDLEIPV